MIMGQNQTYHAHQIILVSLFYIFVRCVWWTTLYYPSAFSCTLNTRYRIVSYRRHASSLCAFKNRLKRIDFSKFIWPSISLAAAFFLIKCKFHCLLLLLNTFVFTYMYVLHTCGSASCSRLRLSWLSSTGPCPATPRVTWPTTVSSSPTPVSDNCVLPTLEHSSVGRAAVLETGPLPPQDHKSGTVCHPISDYVGCHTASSGGYWRHFYSDSEATAQCEHILTAPNRNILTYLLTDVQCDVVCCITAINPCQYNNGGCDQTCSNVAGVFSCGCSAGFTLSSNGRTCVAVRQYLLHLFSRILF